MTDTAQNPLPLAQQTDEALMQQIIARDQRAFGILAERWSVRLVGYFCKQLGQQELAEELAQEVLISLWKAKRYHPSRPFKNWIYTVAHHRLLDEVRRKRLPQSALDQSAWELASHENLENALLQADEQERLQQALHTLPQNQRAVLILSKYQDLDHAQIAQVLDCSRQSVKVMLFRAVKQLTRIFKEMNS